LGLVRFPGGNQTNAISPQRPYYDKDATLTTEPEANESLFFISVHVFACQGIGVKQDIACFIKSHTVVIDWISGSLLLIEFNLHRAALDLFADRTKQRLA